MDYVFVFNAFEVVLWISVAVILLLLREVPSRRLCRIAAVGFLAFAGSDAVEMQTGAWWRPWWLFAWKAACVILLTATALIWYRLRRNQVQPQQATNTKPSDS